MKDLKTSFNASIKEAVLDLKTFFDASMETVLNKMDEAFSSTNNQCMYISMSVDHYILCLFAKLMPF